MTLSDAWDQARQAWRRLAASSEWASEDDDGLAALSDIGVVRRMLDQAELAAVRTARRHDKSWAEIATKLGVTRQSAWERWRDLDDVPSPQLTEPSLESELVAAKRRRATIAVPNVIGLSWDDAGEVLRGCGL